MFLAPSVEKQTFNYGPECSNHHLSLSTLGSKGLSRSKMIPQAVEWRLEKHQFWDACYS